MDVVKFRLSTAVILSALALTSVASSAEKSASKPVITPARAAERPALQGLNNPALNLTADQKARIERIVAGYQADDKALGQQYSAQGARSDAEAATGRKQLRERMAAAVEQVLNSSQRKTLKDAQTTLAAAQAARMAPVSAPTIDGKTPAR